MGAGLGLAFVALQATSSGGSCALKGTTCRGGAGWAWGATSELSAVASRLNSLLAQAHTQTWACQLSRRCLVPPGRPFHSPPFYPPGFYAAWISGGFNDKVLARLAEIEAQAGGPLRLWATGEEGTGRRGKTVCQARPGCSHQQPTLLPPQAARQKPNPHSLLLHTRPLPGWCSGGTGRSRAAQPAPG